jgi:hypothetical protein
MEHPNQYNSGEKPIPICKENFQVFQYIYLIQIQPNKIQLGKIYNAPQNGVPESIRDTDVLLFLEVTDCHKFIQEIYRNLAELFKPICNNHNEPIYGLFFGNAVKIIFYVLSFYMANHTYHVHETTEYSTTNLTMDASELVKTNMKNCKLNESLHYAKANIENHEYIYLIRLREHLVTDRKVYKIGRTAQRLNKRTQSYSNDSKLILLIKVDDCEYMESKLLNIFRATFFNYTADGKEYFRGNSMQMIDIILLRFQNEHMSKYIIYLDNNDGINAKIHSTTNSFNNNDNKSAESAASIDKTSINKTRLLIPNIHLIERNSQEYKELAQLDKKDQDVFKYHYLCKFLNAIMSDLDHIKFLEYCDEPKWLFEYQNSQSRCKNGGYIIHYEHLVCAFRKWTLDKFGADLSESKYDIHTCIKDYFINTSVKGVLHYILYVYDSKSKTSSKTRA